MPEIAWETLIGALALVAIVAGAQYVRTSSSSSSSATPVKQLATEIGKKTGAGKKKKGKKTTATGEKAAKNAEPRSEEKPEAVASSSSSVTGEASYANVAEKAVQQSGVGHDEVIVPATTAAKTSSKKKNKKAKAVAESSTSQAPTPTEQPAKPDTSNDASLAAALSAEEPQDSSSEQESDAPAVTAAASSKRDVGGWEKPKKSINTSDAAWESASSSVPRNVTLGKASGSGSGGSITSTNRFSALSLGAPASTTQHAKKALPRTSTTGTGKHRAHVEEPGMTKLQKKNAATAAAKKAAKETEERERLERLAKYRREQEREKINALYSGPKQGGSKISVAANNRSLSNGMKASVDSGGKLVWD